MSNITVSWIFEPLTQKYTKTNVVQSLKHEKKWWRSQVNSRKLLAFSFSHDSYKKLFIFTLVCWFVFWSSSFCYLGQWEIFLLCGAQICLRRWLPMEAMKAARRREPVEFLSLSVHIKTFSFPPLLDDLIFGVVDFHDFDSQRFFDFHFSGNP